MNILDFNGGAINNQNPSINDKVLAYIGDTGTPCYIPISQIQLLGTRDVIYDNIAPTGTTAATTTTYLNYGINVINTASITAYAMRLPYPPIKGKTLTVVNTSGYPIVIYPSVDGGSINGVVNGSASVPSDGKSYVFTCWENPLPGAWSWTPPATNQYDSGDITFSQAVASSQTIAAINNNLKIVGNGTYSSASFAYDGLNQPLIYTPVLQTGYPTAFFKVNPKWNSITKIKVYTNLSSASSGVFCRITSGDMANYYEIGTTNFVMGGASQGSASPFAGLDKTLAQTVPGASLPAGTLTPNVGDPGTVYDEMIASNSSLQFGSLVGDYYAGQYYDYNNDLRDLWYTRYICFNIRPFQNVTGFKFRFFIEYN